MNVIWRNDQLIWKERHLKDQPFPNVMKGKKGKRSGLHETCHATTSTYLDLETCNNVENWQIGWNVNVEEIMSDKVKSVQQALVVVVKWNFEW
jgi:hypothetical protein